MPRFAADVIVASVLAVKAVVFPKVRVAAVFKVPREVALRVVVPESVVVSALTVRREPAPPFRGLIVIFPVVFPPMVKSWFLAD
jgi:hypothetical protein